MTQNHPVEKLARHRAMGEMRQEAVVGLASVGRLKSTLTGSSARSPGLRPPLVILATQDGVEMHLLGPGLAARGGRGPRSAAPIPRRDQAPCGDTSAWPGSAMAATRGDVHGNAAARCLISPV